MQVTSARSFAIFQHSCMRVHCQQSLLSRPGCPKQHQRSRIDPRSSRRDVTCMGLKAKETFDASFTLDKAAEERLVTLLSSEAFSNQVIQQCQLGAGETCKFSGILFQPVPWSLTTKKGMPQEYEQYLSSPQHVVINVPPNFMFQAKIFKPSRLCAIFEKAQ